MQATLGRLEQQGPACRRPLARAAEIRAGRPRRYYRLEASGRRALNESRDGGRTPVARLQVAAEGALMTAITPPAGPRLFCASCCRGAIATRCRATCSKSIGCTSCRRADRVARMRSTAPGRRLRVALAGGMGDRLLSAASSGEQRLIGSSTTDFPEMRSATYASVAVLIDRRRGRGMALAVIVAGAIAGAAVEIIAAAFDVASANRLCLDFNASDADRGRAQRRRRRSVHAAIHLDSARPCRLTGGCRRDRRFLTELATLTGCSRGMLFRDPL